MYTYVCVCVCMCVFVCVYTHIYTYVCMCVCIGDYFTNLVAKAHDEKATYVKGESTHYYQTRDDARQQSLAQVQVSFASILGLF